ncbi:MAG: alpha/beta fold hydrolase [Dehalococcoidia bacterium]|nr:alpha/beta fold hydrolase [Dehalococcoidia bacterium]
MPDADEQAHYADRLPEGIRSRFVENGNGLRMHLLESAPGAAGEGERPVVLLLHGFPELAYSWRKVMPALAAAGYRVLAPDQRGYGLTTGWDDGFEVDLRPFAMLNLVRDQVGMLARLGIREVAAVVGHDFGSSVAGWCAVVRPDVFRSAAMMSAPFGGPAPWPSAEAASTPSTASGRGGDIHADLLALDPPRKHYQRYYATREADADMRGAPQGVHAFLRGYYHHKSADWPGNRPFPLAAWTAEEAAQMPTYYVMHAGQTMAQTVAEVMPSDAEVAACAWLTEDELAIYSAEYGRTGFQGGLNWYRAGSGGVTASETAVFAGRTLDVPATFISGAQDWGVYQRPGGLEAMGRHPHFEGTHLIEGAGHWVQQEQPQAVVEHLLQFLARHS